MFMFALIVVATGRLDGSMPSSTCGLRVFVYDLPPPCGDWHVRAQSSIEDMRHSLFGPAVPNLSPDFLQACRKEDPAYCTNSSWSWLRMTDSNALGMIVQWRLQHSHTAGRVIPRKLTCSSCRPWPSQRHGLRCRGLPPMHGKATAGSPASFRRFDSGTPRVYFG